MVRLLLLVASLALLGFAPAPLPRRERQRDDLADLTGVWVFVRCETNGRVDPPETHRDYRVEITRTEIAFLLRQAPRQPIQMTLDPGASPPSFSWSIEGRVRFVGSYRLERGELTMIFEHSSDLGSRPRDFTARPSYRYVMRRISR